MSGSSAWLLEAKLRVPVPPTPWLRRALPGLGEATAPLIAFSGGAGMGKTLAMYELVRRREAMGAATVWLGLDEDDGEVATFFYYLVAGLRRHVPDIGREVLDRLRGERAEPRALWRSLLGEVAAFGVPALTLALDDAHHLASSPTILAGLAGLLDKLPRGLTVALTCREQPALAGAFARGLGRSLDERELRFTAEEQQAFWQAHATGTGLAAGRQARAAELDGWPLGLGLLASGGSEAAEPGLEALEAYLIEEVFQVQAVDQQAFMLRAALLSELTPKALASVCGVPDAEARLAALERCQLVRRLEGGSYQFPAYLASFLRALAARTLSLEARLELHRRAAALALAEERPELALGHLIAAADWPTALAVVERVFPAMRHDGRQQHIQRMLGEFPAELQASAPGLVLWRGHLLSRAGKTVEARLAYEAARVRAVAQADAPHELCALVRLSTLAARANEQTAFSRVVRQVLERAWQANPEDLADLHLARAMVADRRGDPALMRECNEAALAIPALANPEIAASHVIARLNLFTAAWQAGELDAARLHAEAARATALAHQMPPYATYAAFLMAQIHLDRGELDAAGQILQAVPPYWPELLDWHMVAGARTILGAWHAARGAWAEAERELQRALALWGEFVLGRKATYAPMARLALGRGQWARVEAIAHEAGLPDDAQEWNAYDLALASGLALARLHAGSAAGARTLAMALAAASQQLGARLHELEARLIEAAACRLLGDEAGAAQALLGVQPALDSTPFAILPQRDPLLWRLAMPPPAEKPAPAGQAPPEASLAVRGFGHFEVQVDGRLVSAWPRRNARVVLAALLLAPGPVSLGQLAELFGGSDASSGLQIAKVSVAALRRALEPALAQASESRFIRTVTDGYELARQQVARCDFWAFELAFARAARLSKEAPAEACEAYTAALALYAGELFGDATAAGAFEVERMRYRRQALQAAMWLAEHAAARGDSQASEAWLCRGCEVAPCDEEVYLSLMRHQQALDRPERARQAYWDCRKALKRLLGSEPSASFEREARRLSQPGP